MSKQNRTTLKSYFETGDIPTQAQFADLIDSFPNLSEKEYGVLQKITVSFADFAGISSPNGFVDFLTLGANETVILAFSNTTVGFDSPNSSALTVAIYDSANLLDISGAASIDIVNAVIDSLNPLSPADYGQPTISASRPIKLSFISSADNLEDFTAGSVDIYYSIVKLP
jgi:hypothetical protein